MGALGLIGIALMFIGGVELFLSEVLGSIVVMTVPFYEISRYAEPERFYFWRSVMWAILLAGLLFLMTGLLL
jgi:hypothetical protein